MARAFISSEFLQGDMTVDLKNLPVLMLRLQIQLQSHGMSLDTQKFSEMVEKDNDVGKYQCYIFHVWYIHITHPG